MIRPGLTEKKILDFLETFWHHLRPFSGERGRKRDFLATRFREKASAFKSSKKLNAGPVRYKYRRRRYH